MSSLAGDGNGSEESEFSGSFIVYLEKRVVLVVLDSLVMRLIVTLKAVGQASQLHLLRQYLMTERFDLEKQVV